MSNILNILSWQFYKLYKLTKPKEEEKFIPSEKDIYLVSYPRSGNTWMRVMLAELMYGESGKSLADLGYYMPDSKKPQLLKETIESDFHIIKTHDVYMESRKSASFKKVIYLIRDPRDVVISWYVQLKTLYYKESLNQFILDWVCGRIYPSSWVDHINSWTGAGFENKNINIFIVRYEDLLLNTIDNLRDVADFLNLEYKEDNLHLAVKKASVKNMKEKYYGGFWEEDADLDELNFIGKATNNQWQDALEQDEIDIIQKYSEKEMKRYGYLKNL